MKLEVALLATLLAMARGIILSEPIPLSYAVSGGYASQYSWPTTILTQTPDIIYKFDDQVTYTTVTEEPTYSTETQNSASSPTVHHPAEFTYASPPVRHAEPINYPIPPALIKDSNRGPIRTATKPVYGPPVAEVSSGSLLGVAYSPSTDVSRMSYTNGYGISYGF